MNMTEQADAMMKTWAEAQKKLLDGWFEIASKGPAANMVASGLNNPLNALKQSLEGMTGETGSLGQGTASQILNGQQAMMRTFEMMSKAWQVVAPSLEAGKDWKPDLRAFSQGWADQLLGAPGSMAETGNDVADLWKSFAGEWGPLLKPWMASMNEMAQGHLGAGLLGGSSGLNKLLSLETDGLSRMFNFEAEREMAFDRLADLPSVGISREQNAKILRAFDAFVDLRKVSTRYRGVLAKAMAQTVERMMGRLTDMAKQGEKVTSVRELNKMWLNLADEVFTEMYGSEEYVALQRELSGAGMKYKIEQQKVVEMVMETLGVPTRSELDDTYKTIYTLKKDVRMLKQELQELKAPAATQARKPATRAATKSTARKADS